VTSFAVLVMLKRYSQGTATTRDAGRRTRAACRTPETPAAAMQAVNTQQQRRGEILHLASVLRGAKHLTSHHANAQSLQFCTCRTGRPLNKASGKR
jgi:hypothetical protein